MAHNGSRRPLMAANWKMHKTVAETEEYLTTLLPVLEGIDGVDIVLCVPYLALTRATELTSSARIRIAAQNMHHADEGAFTGEVSAPMLAEAGVGAVVLGHSERRQLFGETDEALSRKVPAAFVAGLTPILCVGESEAERDAGETQRVLRHQVQRALEHVEVADLDRLVVAYEPIWAIGSGQSASPEQAQEAISFVRALVGDRSAEAAEAVRVLYGGSVKPGNAGDLQAQPDIDGALVGGAALDPEQFAAIAAVAG
ncbi:MAG: triose-phosphate isomerase [Solirubrobacterales bacterium]